MTTPQVLPGRQFESIDADLADLVHGERVWAATDLAGRRELLRRVHLLAGEHARDWVQAACAIKGLPPESPLVGEEWMSGPYAVLTALAALAGSLRALELGRSPVDGFGFGRAPGGRVSVHTLPHNAFDRLLLSGFSCEIWMPPGVPERTVREQAGLGARHPSRTSGVGVVLGAGNISSIPPLDVLTELYAHNRVVALKLNPLTERLLGVFEQVFRPLIDLGVLRILTGGADVGEYLVRHELVSHVHITGSAHTHDAIVFGAGPNSAAGSDGARRKAENRPVLGKPITSELGGVSPVIVLPGDWSAADLTFQAEHVVTQRLHNGGYNCIAGQVLLLGSDWPQKEAFLAQVRSAFERAPARPAYYPGSDQRLDGALAACPSGERLGPEGGRALLSPKSMAEREYLLQNEVFGPALVVIEVPGTGLDFLTAAVRVANEELAGTLGANVIADPKTIRRLGTGFETALAELRYGCIAVNTWTGFGFLTATASWGAYPGHSLDDVQSGIGVVHNALLLENPERTIVRGPFRPAPRSVLHGQPALSPKPPWFVTNRTAASTGEALTAFAARPGWARLPAIFASALRG